MVFDGLKLFMVPCLLALWLIGLAIIRMSRYYTSFLTLEDLYLKELAWGALRALSSLEPVYDMKCKKVILYSSRKDPYLPHERDFTPPPPATPMEIKFDAFLSILQNPLPSGISIPRKSHSLLWGSIDMFRDCALLKTTQMSEIKWPSHLCSPDPRSRMSNVCLDFSHTLYMTNKTQSKLPKKSSIQSKPHEMLSCPTIC